MSYVTPALLTEFLTEAELIRLTDSSGSGAVDAGWTELACIYANAAINGYVGAAYTLPLPAESELLKSLGLDLAHWRCYRYAPLEHVQKAHDAAISRLRDISAGRLKLDLPEGSVATPVTPLIRAGQARSAFDWSRHG